MMGRNEERIFYSLMFKVLFCVSVAVFALFAIGAVCTLALCDRSALWLVGTIGCVIGCGVTGGVATWIADKLF